MGVMVIAALLLVKTHVLRAEEGRVVSAVATYIVNPLVIFNSFLIGYDAEKLRALLVIMACGISLLLLAIILLRLLGRPLRLDRIERASIIYTNSGTLVIPLVQAMLGNEAVFYCSALIVSQNLFLWTHGALLVGGPGRLSLKKVILTPNIIAIFLGLIVFVTRLPLPELVHSTIDQIAGTNAAINMFAIGIILGGVNFREVFTGLRYYLVIAVRLVVCPLIVILLLYVTKAAGLLANGRIAMLVLTLGLSASPAVALTNIAALYGTMDDAKKASALNSMGIILCAFTMPLVVLLYETVF